MGMQAEILAVGRYSTKISTCMEYPADRYANTKDGTIVTRRLFGIDEGSGLSREFAALLGISDPWDFNQHRLNPKKINMRGLLEFATKYNHYDQDVEILGRLIDAEFDLHFRPEG